MPCEVPSGEVGEGRHGWSLLGRATVTPERIPHEPCAVVAVSVSLPLAPLPETQPYPRVGGGTSESDVAVALCAIVIHAVRSGSHEG